MKKTFFSQLMLLGTAGAIALCSLASCSENDSRTAQSSITVSGVGTVYARPDMALLTVRFTHIAPTTKEAKSLVDQKIAEILSILQAEGIEDKHIKTASINYRTEYDYSVGRRTRRGQCAEQSLTVTVDKMLETPERLTRILDHISTINQVEIENVWFDIERKDELFERSRTLAFEKAKSKAKQYAELSDRKLGKVLMITEGGSDESMQLRYRNMAMNTMMAKDESANFAGDGSAAPLGEQGVSSTVSIVFALE